MSRSHIDFAEFDDLDDPRDIEARDNAIALDRMAQDASRQRDQIVRRLRRSIALPTNRVRSIDGAPFDVRPARKNRSD